MVGVLAWWLDSCDPPASGRCRSEKGGTVAKVQKLRKERVERGEHLPKSWAKSSNVGGSSSSVAGGSEAAGSSSAGTVVFSETLVSLHKRLKLLRVEHNLAPVPSVMSAFPETPSSLDHPAFGYCVSSG